MAAHRGEHLLPGTCRLQIVVDFSDKKPRRNVVMPRQNGHVSGRMPFVVLRIQIEAVLAEVLGKIVRRLAMPVRG
ncbi:hypothetical protein D3C76_1852670 [compost metagenome]